MKRGISTTIKKVWLDKILSGEKTVERKRATQFWITRLQPFVGKTVAQMSQTQINFLCGKYAIKYRVKTVVRLHSGTPIDIDGVPATDWYEIYLGERVE